MKCYIINDSKQLSELSAYAMDKDTKRNILKFCKQWQVIEKVVPRQMMRVTCFLSISKHAYVFAKLPVMQTERIGEFRKTPANDYAEKNLKRMGE